MEILERVHMDLAINVASDQGFDGSRHFLVIVDEFSRKTWSFAISRIINDVETNFEIRFCAPTKQTADD
jgi:hypothetical protein